MSGQTQEESPTRAELKAVEWTQLDPNNIYDLITAKNYLIWINEKRIAKKLYKRIRIFAKEWDDFKYMARIAKIISIFKVKGVDSVVDSKYNENKIAELLRQRWNVDEIKISKVDIDPITEKLIIIFRAPNGLPIKIINEIEDFKDLNKEEYKKVLRVYKKIKNKIYRAFAKRKIKELGKIIDRLMKEKEELKKRVAELELELEKRKQLE